METVRKELWEGLSVKERRGLMHDRVILLKRNQELSDMEQITLCVDKEPCVVGNGL